jgi:hypothetical protein
VPDALTLRAASAALLISALSFFYRFNALGGALGGVGNDHFIHLARARQIVAGELPFRDFSDPGAPLTSGMSALAQWLFGHSLIGEAILTVGAISVGAGLTCWLACRLTGRVWPGLLVALLQIGIAPRLYNYPKIFLTAAGILIAWRYVDRQSPARLYALSAIIAVGFLFRHDYAIYLGTLAVATVLLVHRHQITAGVRHVAQVALVSLLALAPFALFLQASGGIVRYLTQSAEFARADSQRTSFRFPVFDIDILEPLIALAPEPPAPPTRVNVRWDGSVTPELRATLEQQYSLRRGEVREGTTWTYELADTSARNIEALVRDARVRDTHGVNRSTYTTSGAAPDRSWGATLARLRLAPELTSEGNAVAWLYYLLVALPAVAAVTWMLRYRAQTSDRGQLVASAPYLWPVIITLALLAVGFLSRGTTDARLADVSVPAGILAAWLLSVSRSAARVAVVAVLLVSAWEIGVLGAVRSTADRSGFLDGPAAIAERTSRVAGTLSASPPVDSLVDDANTPMARLARWVNRCTAPGDRLFVIGNMPELYFFSGRLAAGGHMWFVPGYGISQGAQEETLARVRAHHVPLVIADAERYDTDYTPEFPIVARYIADHYEPVGTFPLGDTAGLTIRLRRDARWEATDAETGLPCGLGR